MLQTDGCFRLAAEQFRQADEQLRTAEVQLRKWLVRLEARSSSGRFSSDYTPVVWNRVESLLSENHAEPQPVE